MQGVSRRKFVTTSGILAAGVATIGYGVASRRSAPRGTICLLPAEGVEYSESFTRFMKRAKFDSVRDAIASIRDSSTPVRIANINATDLYKPLTGALR